MNTNKISKKLLELGFNANEAKVYLLLLESGLSTAGFLIKKSSFHRNVVYTALDKLISRKLVTEFEQNGVKHYKTLDPARIVEEAIELNEKASEILPELKNLRKTKGVEVLLYENVEGFQSVHKQALLEVPDNGTVYVMGTRASFYKNMGESYKNLDKIRQKKNIKLKVIGFISTKAELQVARPLMQTKFIEENFVSPVGTSIYGSNVLIQIYSDPTIVVRIKSAEVAKSYLEYFVDNPKEM
jgi:sugar-specific transcriptional regulator TrmB